MDVATSSEQAIEHSSQRLYDVALLDWQLDPKGLDGLDVCRCLCRNYTEMGIIFITAYDDVRDKILALEAGADDYLAKLFDVDGQWLDLTKRQYLLLVTARCRAFERPSWEARGSQLASAVGDLEIPRQDGEIRGGMIGGVHHSPTGIWANRQGMS